MCNIETCLSPKFSWRCFLVVFSLFLLFFSCTTTESDQKRHQLAKRMTGGEKVKHTELFYARVYTFRVTARDQEEPVSEILRTCAGTFIFVDLVLTALQCVLFNKENLAVHSTVVHHEDFNKPQKGSKENYIVEVIENYKNPHFAKDRFTNGIPINDVALLRIKLFSYSFWSPGFMHLPPCHEKTIREGYQLKMLGMKKTKGHFTIEDPISAIKGDFFFDSQFVQEAQFRKVNPLKLFKRVYKNKKVSIKWNIQRKLKLKPLPPHRIVAFSEQGAQMDEDKGEIGSPAFLYDNESKKPVCLYGVLSGFIYGQQSDTFNDPDKSGEVPNNAQIVTAVELEGIFFYHEWLEEQIDKGKERYKQLLIKGESERDNTIAYMQQQQQQYIAPKTRRSG